MEKIMCSSLGCCLVGENESVLSYQSQRKHEATSDPDTAFLNHFNPAISYAFSPTRQQPSDEHMVKYKDHSSLKQNMKG